MRQRHRFPRRGRDRHVLDIGGGALPETVDERLGDRRILVAPVDRAAHVGDHHRGAAFDQQGGNRGADSARAAGHDGDPSGQRTRRGHRAASCQMRAAMSTTRASLARWSSGLTGLPMTALENPHCGLTARRSSGT